MLRHLICTSYAPHMLLICCCARLRNSCNTHCMLTPYYEHTLLTHTLLSHTSLTQAGQEESAIRARLAGTDAEVTNQRNIDQMQFITAMMGHIGYKGTPWVLDGVFRSIDSDGDGEMTVG